MALKRGGGTVISLLLSKTIPFEQTINTHTMGRASICLGHQSRRPAKQAKDVISMGGLPA